MNLHHFLINAAGKSPDSTAVMDPRGPVSYGELDQWANTVARRLRNAGVTQGDRVVIWAEKSAAVIAAMQAVLRLGAAYVPVDGTTPAGRAGSIARDCAARAVLTNRPDQIVAEVCADVVVDSIEQPSDTDTDPVNTVVSCDDLAYILYTSGSTGTPKGVCISHRNAMAFIDWAVAELDPYENDRFSNHAPLTFDLSVLDLYAAFAVGASVHLVPAELAYAPVQLVDFLYEHQITVWYSVPSALTLMMREGGLLSRPAPPSLRAVLFAGEPFPIAQVRMLAEWTSAVLMNLYGPTETNVCTFHTVTPQDVQRDRPLPIGTAASGDVVWVERADGSRAAVGEEGELIVDGPTVMLGYWGKEPQEGSYRTGDIVRALPGAAFEYLGRRDHMVKVRGHRVELGEVEAVLTAHPDVAEATVVVAGVGIAARLVAFVVPRQGCKPGILALRQHSAQRLPRYMLADEVRVLAEMPRTHNGKVDRRALEATASR
jgi:amino acid adenylation domain-containing protein